MSKISLVMSLAVTMTVLGGCGKDPAVHEKELRLQIAAATRIIDNYKANKYEGVEQLEEWKKGLETELDELSTKR